MSLSEKAKNTLENPTFDREKALVKAVYDVGSAILEALERLPDNFIKEYEQTVAAKEAEQRARLRREQDEAARLRDERFRVDLLKQVQAQTQLEAKQRMLDQQAWSDAFRNQMAKSPLPQQDKQSLYKKIFGTYKKEQEDE